MAAKRKTAHPAAKKRPPLPKRIPDTPENIAKAVLSTPPKKADSGST